MRLATSDDIGDRLRRAREARGIALERAAEDTRIAPEYLAALERDAPPEEFPEPWYARAFLREYARYLGLRSGPLLDAYQAMYPRRIVSPIGVLPLERRRGIGLRRILLVLAVLALAAIVVVSVRRDAGQDPEPPTRAVPRPASPTAPSSSPSPSPVETVRPGVRLSLQVTSAPSWIRVTRGDEVLLEGTQQPGFSETFRDGKQLEVRLGNPSAVRMTVNGQEEELPNTGEVYSAQVRWVKDEVRVVT